MRRLGWVIAGVGIAAAAASRLLKRPSAPPVVADAPPPPPEPAVEDDDVRADELRQRIAEAREALDERDEFEQAETPVDEADPDARRRSVHERGRSAVDEMRGEPG